MPKRPLREEMLMRRQHLAAATCLSRSLAAQERLLAAPEFAGAASLALYCPIRNEVFTEGLFATSRRLGKRVAFPRVRGELLEFVEVNERQELAPGAFGILEPVGEMVVPLAVLDLIVVPGVAFDRSGYRLGYGKGFYDRVLHGGGGVLAGLCFDFQLVDALPAETHDVRMDLVVSDERMLRFGAPSATADARTTATNPNQVRRVGT